MDNQVHVLASPNQNYYSDMSIWDIHRTQVRFQTYSTQSLRDICSSR